MAHKAGEARISFRAAFAGGALAAGLGVCTLAGWTFGWLRLASFSKDFIPMAPSTAALFIVFGSAIMLRACATAKGTRRLGKTLDLVGTLTAIVLLVLSCLEVQLPVEHLGLSVADTFGGAPLGHMSPITAFCFVLAGFSFLASFASTPERPRLAIEAFFLACLLVAICAVLLLGYLSGRPFFYGGSIIPPAVSTLLAFLALGVALLSFSRVGLWPHNEPVRRASFLLVMVFLGLIAGTIAAGHFYYQNYKSHFRAEIERELKSVAELKVSELVQYRNERLADGATFFGNKAFAGLVKSFFAEPENAMIASQLQSWLAKYQEHYQYDRVFLMDADCAERLSAPEASSPVSSAVRAGAADVLRTGRVALHDFHRNEYDDCVYLTVLIPIMDDRDGGRGIGVLALRIDPQTYLYPFINRWPTPSETAEAVIVRREGNEIVHLNDLRFQKNTALVLRFSLDDTDMPAAKAALGQEGIVEGRNYKGTPVLAALRAVPDSPWLFVAQKDLDEAYAPLRERLWQMIAVIAFLLVGAAVAVGSVFRQQHLRFYQERYRAAEALRASEEKFRGMAEHLADVLYTTDDKGVITYVSPSVRLVFGLDPEDMIGRSFSEFLAEGEASHALDVFWTAIQSGHPQEGFRAEMKRRDGSCFTGELNSSILWKDGRAAGTIGLIRDISERLRTEKELRALFEYEKALLAAIPDIVMEVDANKIYTYANEAGLAFFGDDVVGKEAADYFVGDQHVYEEVQPLFNGDENVIYIESMQRRRDGEPRLLAWWCRVLKDENGQPVGAISSARDITDRRREEEDRKRLEAQLRQAQKMEAVGLLAGGVAHDFNNLLQGILGYTELVLCDSSLGDKIRADLIEVQRAAERAAQLTRQLLAFSRRQVIDPQPMDLNAVVAELARMIRRVIGEHIELDVIPGHDLATVRADRSQIEQVLMNLCVNARDAMSEGGRLTIETQNVVFDTQYCATHEWAVPGRYVLLSVTDSGCGMESDTMQRIFDPFFTTKEKGRGTGLGLATVYGIVRQHDGMIQVYSEVGKGSKFKVYLPAIEQSAAVVERAIPEPVLGGGETILLAEDNLQIRKLAKRILEGAGYTVLDAADGEEALVLYRQHGRAVDLLLLDVVMPKKGGRAVYDEIRAKRPGIRCLFASGYSENAVHTNFILESGMHLLQKPYQRDSLLRAVRKVLDE
ncbi:MAG TPA: PAS domain S-box protein [Candidatus Hydrogenedentes bacterium]|nr:PAS domain S-box protein [Candidatus Hydrogenedentota bacterium]